MRDKFKILYYVLYLVGIVALVTAFLYYQQLLQLRVARTFEAQYAFLYLTMFPIIIGAFLALPSKIRLFGIDGQWKVNWAKLATLAVPLLIITTMPLWMWHIQIKIPMFSTVTTDRYIIVIGIIAGYFMIDTIEKIKE